ncbi:MAG: 3-keto-disaccharide hydrolase, partial [Phycisphaerales bacterium]
ASPLALAQQTPKADAPKQDSKAASPETEKGWTVLFDGKNADSFRGYKKDKLPEGWEIADGALHMKKGSSAGDIITKEQFENFELSFEWKISEGGNSGIMYHVQELDGPPYLTGPEYQILDNKKHNDGKKPETSAASCYALYACSEDATKPVGEWNTSKLVVNNNKVEHWLNGKKVVEYTIGSDDWKKRIAASKFKDWKEFGQHAKGHVAFQDHGDDVWYKNIKVKNLEAKDQTKPEAPAKGTAPVGS